MPLPVTINRVVKNKELNITPAKLAELLGVGSSQILNGKLEPDVAFLKAIHSKLGISADSLFGKCVDVKIERMHKIFQILS